MPALRIRVGLVVKPLMSGFAARVAIPFRSAPSAKILTFSLSSDFMLRSAGYTLGGLFQNDFCRFRQGLDRKVRRFGFALRVMALHQNRSTTCGLADRHIAPAVADHPGTLQINPPFPRRRQQHPRLGLAAIATIRLDVITHLDIVNGEPFAQSPVHFLDRLALGQPRAHVRLIRDDDQNESRCAQAFRHVRHAGQKLKLLHPCRRHGLAVAQQGPAQHAVAVQKDGAMQTHFFANPSHLFACNITRGCDTSPCHTTAWKDSVWGVTALASTVGTTITQSPTFFVWPPSRPTMPKTFSPRFFPSSNARTRFGLTFFSALPPPTDITKMASLEFARLTFNHASNTVAQPSSFVRAVSSETLSHGL